MKDEAALLARRTGSQSPPRARGRVVVSARVGGARSRIGALHQSGSLKALFPRPHGSALDAVLVNTAGGITGGDEFSVEAQAETGTRLTLTTQAAERAYRAAPGPAGRMDTRLTVGAGARLDWLPQETILYDGCRFHRRLTADLSPGARLLIAEPVIFGRTAMGETVTRAAFRDRIEIRRDDRPVYLDALDLSGNIAARLSMPFVAGGSKAMAMIVLVAPVAEALLGPLRALLPETAGASLIGSDLLVARVLAADGYSLRQSLVPALECLAGDTLPRPWML